MLTPEQIRRYRDEGFLTVRGVLSPECDLAPLREAWPRLIDRLGRIMLDNAPDLRVGFEAKSLGEKLAILSGVSRGLLFDHLDPVLRLHRREYRRRRDLPDPRIRELFDLMRHERILDVVEGLLGPEISASPAHHVNTKLGERHLEQARRLARTRARGRGLDRELLEFHLGTSPRHADAGFAQPDGLESDIVVCWLPMYDAGARNSALFVAPRSHHSDCAPLPDVPLEMASSSRPI